MKDIIQLQYSLTDRVFNDIKNITQSSLHPTQPNPPHGWTQPMTNPVLLTSAFYPRDAMRKRGLCCRRVCVRPSVCHTLSFLFS